MTKQYELMAVNLKSGKSKTVDVFDIEDFFEDEYEGAGICLFFDSRGDLAEVMASEVDIMMDSESSAQNTSHYFYAIIKDEKDIYESFLMMREGIIDFSSIDLPLHINITMSRN